MESKEMTNIDQDVIMSAPIHAEEDDAEASSSVATSQNTASSAYIETPLPEDTLQNMPEDPVLDEDLTEDPPLEDPAVVVVAEEIGTSTPTHTTEEEKRSGPKREMTRTTVVASTRIVTADSVQAEEVPTIPLGSLQKLSTLQPEVAIHSVAATQSFSIPAPLVVQPSEYRRGLSEWIQVWWGGLRPGYLPLAIMPLLLGNILAWTQTISTQNVFGSFHPVNLLSALLAALLLQLGANLVNDYYDYRRGVDTANTLGPGGLIQQGLVSPAYILKLGFSLLGAGILLGLIIAFAGGPLAYLSGLLGVLCAYFYSAPPRSLSSLGLGEAVGFLTFGPLITLGAALVQSGGMLSPNTLAYSLAPGFLAAAVIHLNNMRDIEDDEHAGKHTLAARLGMRWSRVWALILLLAAYAPIILSGVPHTAPHFVLLSLWTLPTLVIIITGILRTDTAAGFHLAMRQSIKLLVIFTLWLIVGLIISAFIPVIPHIPQHLLPL